MKEGKIGTMKWPARLPNHNQLILFILLSMFIKTEESRKDADFSFENVREECNVLMAQYLMFNTVQV